MTLKPKIKPYPPLADMDWVVNNWGPPKWVKIITNILSWVDNHPIHLLPLSWRNGRWAFYDRYCACSSCETRRINGQQEPGVSR